MSVWASEQEADVNYPEHNPMLPVITVDFDGMLAAPTWPSPHLGKADPDALALVRHYYDKGCEVHVLTARPDSHFPRIWRWLQDNGIEDYIYDVTGRKPVACAYWDDRAQLYPLNKDTDLAWAAGLFEGEGSFMARVMNSGTRAIVKRRCLHMCLSTTDEDVVRRFNEVVGIGYVVGPLRHKNTTHKDYWRWEVAGKKAEALADRLSPYLGERRLATLEQKRLEIAANPPKRGTRNEERVRSPETGRYVA